jgi:hypothetical protein
MRVHPRLIPALQNANRSPSWTIRGVFVVLEICPNVPLVTPIVGAANSG